MCIRAALHIRDTMATDDVSTDSANGVYWVTVNEKNGSCFDIFVPTPEHAALISEALKSAIIVAGGVK